MLETEKLRKTYGRVVALAGLDLTVRSGEIVGLLGPNGAGKTTALRMIAAILTPTSGRARVCGHDVQECSARAKRNMGFLSGDTALYKRLTPREIMVFFGRLHGMASGLIEERSRMLIDRLDMAPFADRRCGTLSAGQQQRANIARALLHDPAVLIMDEPTTALDIVSGQFILENLLQARDEGKAILFSTHEMEEARRLCDRVFLLHKGEIGSSGTLEELREETGLSDLGDIFLEVVTPKTPPPGEPLK